LSFQQLTQNSIPVFSALVVDSVKTGRELPIVRVQQVDFFVQQEGIDHLEVALLTGNHEIADVVWIGGTLPLES
jgi:hypothetical protein